MERFNVVAVDEITADRIAVALHVTTRPSANEGITLQDFYEDIAYNFADYERAKIASQIDVELNPVNDSAMLRFEVKRPKKPRQRSLLKKPKHKKHAL